MNLSSVKQPKDITIEQKCQLALLKKSGTKNSINNNLSTNGKLIIKPNVLVIKLVW